MQDAQNYGPFFASPQVTLSTGETAHIGVLGTVKQTDRVYVEMHIARTKKDALLLATRMLHSKKITVATFQVLREAIVKSNLATDVISSTKVISISEEIQRKLFRCVLEKHGLTANIDAARIHYAILSSDTLGGSVPRNN